MNHRPGQLWQKYSEEWYWDILLNKVPFRSIYEDEPGSRQPLIYGRERNLSQTPREQCELQGLLSEGLERQGPGQEVELHGLSARPELNGKRGRVLPSSGPGAPPSPPDAGRAAVRLADGSHNIIAVRPDSLRSPHAAAAATTAGATAAGPKPPTAAAGAASQQQQPSVRRAKLADLLQNEFQQWSTGASISHANLRRAGMPEALIKCCSCGCSGQSKDHYCALKRTAPLSHQPLAPGAVRLQCVACFTADADASGVKLTESAVEDYVNERMMGAVQVCSTLMGHETMSWGGMFGSGALY